MNRKKCYICKESIIFLLFGLIYCEIELLYRGHTHWTMFIVGGLCGLLIGLINEITPKMNIWLQMFLGSIIVTLIEFISGYILNIKLGLGIWNYSKLPFNFMGQIDLIFTIAWFFLSYAAIYLDDFFRKIMDEI